jgi:hypothetical protein
MNELKFDLRGRVKEQFNLQGQKIESITMSWVPYLSLGDCDSAGRNCKSVEGLLADYMGILSQKFNFTWETFFEVDKKWGTRPLSGPANKSGTWGGVFGGVVNEDYDMSLSTW